MATLRRVFHILRLASLEQVPNVVSTACKDLSYLTYFNNDKKDQVKEEHKYLKRLVTVSTTSTLVTEAKKFTLEQVLCI